MVSTRIAFGPFELDPDRGCLLREGRRVPIGQRAAAVLAALLETPGRTVSKGELLARAWPGTIVEEGNLTVQVAALRRALGPAPEGREWIVTVPRLGYRLVAGEPAAPADGALPALAVLPFQVLGGESGEVWFAEGVTADILTALGRFRSFSVVGAERAGDPREVARDLGVRYVLRGSLRRAAERLRITAELVDGVTGVHLWAQSFEGSSGDVFDFQDRIAEQVASVIEPQIQTAEIRRGRRERPGSAAAYDIYLQARAKMLTESERANAEVYRLLNEALALDPDNPRMLAHAAWAIEHRTTMGWAPFGPDDRERCADLARRGLEHAAGDPSVIGLCGIAILQCVRDYDWGMAVLSAAAEDNPNDLMVATQAGTAHLHCGSLDTALALYRRALRLNPRHPTAHICHCGTAHARIVRGEYAEALEAAAQALALNPNFDATLWMLVAANAHLGRMDEARRFLAALLRLSPDLTVARIRAGQPAKDPGRIEPILEGLRLAGLPAG
jgi:TolB-like protein/DNA-binding winged helix-turn-helix (wHTH) protein